MLKLFLTFAQIQFLTKHKKMDELKEEPPRVFRVELELTERELKRLLMLSERDKKQQIDYVNAGLLHRQKAVENARELNRKLFDQILKTGTL